MLVIDASMALAWVFERQQAADAQRAADLLSSCGAQPWWVPSLWHLEVANALLVAERRRVIASSASDLLIQQGSVVCLGSKGNLISQVRHTVVDRRCGEHQHPRPDSFLDDLAHQAVIACFATHLGRSLVTEVMRFINHDKIIIAPVDVAKVNIS